MVYLEDNILQYGTESQCCEDVRLRFTC